LINVCKGDNSGSKDTLKLELENENGEKCETDPLDNFVKDRIVHISSRYFDRQGNKCSNLELSSTTKVRLFNKGTDDLCITDLQLDVVNKNKQRIQICRFDTNTYNPNYADISVNGENNLPLICH